MSDRESVVAVEWADRVDGVLAEPERLIHVHLAHIAEQERRVDIDIPDAMASRFERFSADVHREEAMTEVASCIICGSEFQSRADTFPFCSNRCRMVDLNRWFGGKYTISRALGPTDELN